jgi:hypothetical protein
LKYELIRADRRLKYELIRADLKAPRDLNAPIQTQNSREFNPEAADPCLDARPATTELTPSPSMKAEITTIRRLRLLLVRSRLRRFGGT